VRLPQLACWRRSSVAREVEAGVRQEGCPGSSGCGRQQGVSVGTVTRRSGNRPVLLEAEKGAARVSPSALGGQGARRRLMVRKIGGTWGRTVASPRCRLRARQLGHATRRWVNGANRYVGWCRGRLLFASRRMNATAPPRPAPRLRPWRHEKVANMKC